MRLLLIDNHDSFSAILYQYLWELTGIRPLFHRNDGLSRAELQSLDFAAAVLSPGPGRPENPRDFGICRDLLESYPDLPILGVCLGHQGLAHFAGGKIIPLHGALHGRASSIQHDGEGLFRGLPQDFQAVRYHSLVVEAKSLPENVRITAWSEDDYQVMGLKFSDRPWFGVQFHPESIGTEHGKALLANFLKLAKPGGINPCISSVSDAYPKNQGEKVRHHELSWKDPKVIFARYFSEAETAFWLDGSDINPKAGWFATYMGRADSVFEWRGDLHDFRAWYDGLNLENQKSAPWPGYRGGPVGHFAYEALRFTLGLNPASSGEPFGRWMVPEGYLVFNHAERRIFAAWEKESPPAWLQALMDEWEEPGEQIHPVEDALPPFSGWKPLQSSEEYTRNVRQLQKSIAAGDTYEACLTHAFTIAADADTHSVFRRLRRQNPAPFAAYLAFPDLKLLSVSPELFLELSADGMLRSRPIKGTRPRGRTRSEDESLRAELSIHPKDRAENLMIVDMTRHDFSRVCAPGSVEAPFLMEVETHPAVFQLVSEVRGKMEEHGHPLDAVWSCFPGGSMTGAPKERTVEILSALETEPRGAYSGALGYFTHGGAFTLSMVIRTLENQGRNWRIGCGGAVLADSDPEAEWGEATLKARSVIDAAGGK